MDSAQSRCDHASNTREPTLGSKSSFSLYKVSSILKKINILHILVQYFEYLVHFLNFLLINKDKK